MAVSQQYPRSISEQLRDRKVNIDDSKKEGPQNFAIKAKAVETEEQEDLIDKRYRDYEQRLREASGNPEAFEIQYFCYKKLKNKETQKFKFRQAFLQKLPSKNNNVLQKIL